MYMQLSYSSDPVIRRAKHSHFPYLKYTFVYRMPVTKLFAVCGIIVMGRRWNAACMVSDQVVYDEHCDLCLIVSLWDATYTGPGWEGCTHVFTGCKIVSSNRYGCTQP